jgi:hypothetical protein
MKTKTKKSAPKKKLTPKQLGQFNKLLDEQYTKAKSGNGLSGADAKKIFNQWDKLEKKVGRKVSHDELIHPYPNETQYELAKQYLENAFYGLDRNDKMPRYFDRKIYLNAVITFLQEQLLEWHNMNNTKGIEYNDNGRSITMTIKNGKSKTIIKSPIIKDVTGEKISIEVIG